MSEFAPSIFRLPPTEPVDPPERPPQANPVPPIQTDNQPLPTPAQVWDANRAYHANEQRYTQVQPETPSPLPSYQPPGPSMASRIIGRVRSAVTQAPGVVEQAGLGAAESVANIARDVARGRNPALTSEEDKIRFGPDPDTISQMVARGLGTALNPSFNPNPSTLDIALSFPGLYGAKGFEAFAPGAGAFARAKATEAAGALTTRAAELATEARGPLGQRGAIVPGAMPGNISPIQLSISEIRSDLKKELERRAAAGEGLPVGLQTGATSKRIVRFVDEMPDALAQDWHSTIFMIETPGIIKEPWQMTIKDYDTLYAQFRGTKSPPGAHRQLVETALADRKPVPPEVLADYPNLVAEAPPVPQAPAQVARPPATPSAAPTVPLVSQTPVAPSPPPGGMLPSVPPGGIRPPVKPPLPPPPAGAPAQPPSMPAGITRILDTAKAVVERDTPGTVTRVLNYLPGTKQIVQGAVPALEQRKGLTAAWVGKGLAITDVETALQRERIGQFQQLEEVFGKGATTKQDFKPKGIQFIGTTEQGKYPYVGTLADIMARPSLYDLSQEQRGVLTAVQNARSNLFESIKADFGLDINQFPVQPGGVHLPNVDISEKALDVSGTLEAALRRGRTKERFYATAADRWAADSTFRPETTIGRLLEANDQTLAKMAGQKVFLEGSGGLDRLEAMRATHPELVGKMEGLQQKLQSLRGSLGRLDERQGAAIKDFLDSPLEDVDLTKLQADLNPKIKRPVFFNEAENKYVFMPAGVNFGKDVKAIQREMDGVKQAIDDLRPGWRTANLSPYTFVQEGVFRYFPAKEAEQVRKMLKVSDNPILRFVVNLTQTAFGGDLSPATLQGMIAWASHPMGASRSLLTHRVLSEQGMIRLVQQNPEKFQRFTQATGINPLGGVTSEFGVGLLGGIPKVGKIWTEFNEALYRPLISLQADIFDSSYQAGLRHGLTDLQAMAVAADDAAKIIPRVNYRRFGQSQQQAARMRAALTSVSFLTQPAAMINDATKGLLKIGLKQTITPTESFALRRVLTLIGTLETISVLSNIHYARSNDLDVEQAIKDSFNPSSGKFLSLRLPNGSGIGLGGPFRSFIRAVAPGDVPGVPVPVPFARLPQFARGKVGPAAGIVYDEIRNKDFYDREIRTGNFPVNVLQGLEYALEGSIPLTVGTSLQEYRQGTTGSQIGQQTVSQFLGTNLAPQSMRDVRDAVAWELFHIHAADLDAGQTRVVESDPRVKEMRTQIMPDTGNSDQQRAYQFQLWNKAKTDGETALSDHLKAGMDGVMLRKKISDLLTQRRDVGQVLLDNIGDDARKERQAQDVLADSYWAVPLPEDAETGRPDFEKQKEIRQKILEQARGLGIEPGYINGVGPGTYHDARFSDPLVARAMTDYENLQRGLEDINYWTPLDGLATTASSRTDLARFKSYEAATTSGQMERWKMGQDLAKLPESIDAMKDLADLQAALRNVKLRDRPDLDAGMARFYDRLPQTIQGQYASIANRGLRAIKGLTGDEETTLIRGGVASFPAIARLSNRELDKILGDNTASEKDYSGQAQALMKYYKDTAAVR